MPPQVIIDGYKAMVAADATRPVYLNLGQGVAADTWYGRGNRTNHPEDYPLDSQGADILSFDTYPMNVFTVPDSAQEAIDFLLPRLTANDIVLVKGSRGMRMERVVAGLEEHS